MNAAGWPFRRIPTICFAPGIRFSTLETLPIDALEVFNAATTLRRYNRYAFKYAQVRGLPMTAASDAHHHAAIGTAYTILNTDDFSVHGILAQIVKSNELNQQYPHAEGQRAQNLEQLDASAPARNIYRQQPRNSTTANGEITTTRIRYGESSLRNSPRR